MDTLGYAGLQFPASLMAGIVVSGTLFWGLWSLTDHTYQVIEVDRVKIDFSRQQLEQPPEKAPREKVVREEHKTLIPDLGPIGPGTAGTEPTAEWKPLVVDPVPTSGGVPVGMDMQAAPVLRINPNYPPREAAKGV